MEGQKNLASRVSLEEFSEAITSGVLRALAAQRLEAANVGAETTQALFVNPIIRCGIWYDIARGPLGTVQPGGPIGPIGGPQATEGAQG